MSILDTKFNYNHLSLKDLLEARDLFHVHLINKHNVIATAIGRYRIRHSEPWPNEEGYVRSFSHRQREARRLDNSEVRDYSWPCILVFVSEWAKEADLIKKNGLVPSAIYLPDGRIVPICVIEAPKVHATDDSVDTSRLAFPSDFIGGGFPIILNSQGTERIASVGCVVTDGNKYYAMTNKHVVGEKGEPVYTRMGGTLREIGVSSGKNVGHIPFEDAYTSWAGKNVMVNSDIGLIEIKDINQWKTDVVGIGEIGELADLNTANMTLSLISSIKKVPGPGNKELRELFPTIRAFGAVSGEMKGEIVGLFYRYKSVGGIEYVADFLIGGRDGELLNIHHGDSGTLWMLETEEGNRPMALHWGQHEFISGAGKESVPYALAANLTTACVRLNVDLVRGWNIDNDYTWGKTGHFKIAAQACELVSNKKLKKLLMANQKNIGYVDSDLLSKNVVSGAYKDSKDKFVPLADVADIIWRSKRPNDSANHFADIDESHPKVEKGKTLLELCIKDDSKVDLDFWLETFAEFDKVAPNMKNGKLRPREGALPFRVWQMYAEMIKHLKAKKIAEFVAAGGTMAHYVGDACQSLHISHLHHGRNASESEVHSVYETTMLDRKMSEVFSGVNAEVRPVKTGDLIGDRGKDAAVRVIELMSFTHKKLAPETICDSYTNNNHSATKMWNDLGKKTISNIAEGCLVMAILWQSAWKAGDGDANFTEAQMKTIDGMTVLKPLYETKTFVQSYSMRDPKFKKALP